MADKISVMADFYSDRAVAHASFFLASFFGLFSILALAQSNQDSLKWIWAIPYWLLFLGSLYTFTNFSLYATYAEGIIQQASMYDVKEVRDAIERTQKTHLILKWHQVLKHYFPVGIFPVIGLLYVLVAFFSYGMVLGFDQAFNGIIATFAIVGVFWLYVLYRC